MSKRSDAPRHLHSFPTRRSSDLHGARAGEPDSEPGKRQDEDEPAPVLRDHERSEEHTSELQSPYDLVCRLLLEKKNHTALADTLENTRNTLAHVHANVVLAAHTS